MPQVPKIVMEEPQPRTTPLHWGQKDPRLLLVVFDTAAVARINAREKERMPDKFEEFELKLPAKYAVRWHHGWDDDGVVAQVLLFGLKGNANAEWFDRFSDLPYAVAALRERFPDAEIPEQVSYVIDWPLHRDKLTPGATLVKTEALCPA